MSETIYDDKTVTLYDTDETERLVDGLDRAGEDGWGHYVRRLAANDPEAGTVVSDVRFHGHEAETDTVVTPYYVFHFSLDIEWNAVHGDIESGFHEAPAVDVSLVMIEERVTGAVLWEGNARLEVDTPDIPLYVDSLITAEGRAMDEAYTVEKSL